MFLTAKKVAELFNVTELTVYRWAKSGKVPSFNVGGVIRFDYDEIMEYIRKGVDEK
ncbi:helix-turn-helix domain-containing protein [Lysinibacillus sp. ACHW1.5]|uniref:helix-turn-helix domain-containing protein n=1 Tax=Lysinibacillus sp. ACHW1.5 TaxID=2913506 RepID=UPI001EDAB994|nr:helix-turn-helix domain-containing protein [Lysinibacillus sp. ACHW1.5]UKJ44262.1 helix-turn-helix domain-containing protein [Lysinibacillus sp. ACHW1.5]